MLTNRKLKKRLQKEADLLLQAKKEEMLSFYQPAGEQRTHGRRFPVRRAVAISMAVLLLAAVLGAVSFSRSRPLVDTPMSGDVSSETSVPAVVSETSSASGAVSGNAALDLPIWIDAFYETYTAVEILEVTEETMELHTGEYTKIKCKMIFRFASGRFSKPTDDGFDGGHPDDGLREIYVISDSVADIEQYDMIFYQTEVWNMNGNYYSGPNTNENGQAEYLPFIDGRISIPEGAFETESFYPLGDLNEEIQHMIDSAERGHESEYTKACPKFLFADGLSLEQVVQFFQDSTKLKEVFDKNFHGCCIVYE